MTIEKVKSESTDQQDRQQADATLVVNSSLNACKSTTDIAPIIITPLAINILEQLQKNEGSDVIMRLPTTTTTMISPALLQADKPKNLTPEEKRQRRLWRNRVAAKECRKKKKLYIHDLEGTIARLTEENSNLRKQAEELRLKVAALPMNDENFRLLKQVEKLNAKLEEKRS